MQLGHLNPMDEAFGKDPEPHVPVFDFRAVGRILRRRAASIVALTALFVAGAYAMQGLERPVFAARASLLLQAPNLQAFGREEIFTATKFDNPMIESQLQVLRSPMLLSQVVQDLGLDRRGAFVDPPQAPLRQRWQDWRAAMGWAGVAEAALPSGAMRFQDAVEQLAEAVSVSRTGLTQVLNVEVTTHSAALSAEIANAIADSFVTGRYAQRRDAAGTAADWFDARLAELNRSAAAVEARIAALGTAKTGAETGAETGAGPADGAGATTGPQSAAAAQAALRTAITARIAAEAAQERIEIALLAADPFEALAKEGGGAAAIGAGLADLAARHGAALAAGDGAAAQALRAEAQAGLQAARDPAAEAVTAARHDEALAREALAQARGAAQGAGPGGSAAAQAQLRSLESEAKIYREMHERYMQGYLQTAQQQSFPASDALVIGAAVAPDGPTGAGGARMLVLAALLGASVGIGAAFLRETADPMLRSRAALAAAVGAPVLGLLPPASAGKALPAPGPRIALPKRVNPSGTNVVVLPQNRLPADAAAADLANTLVAPRSAYAETIRRIRVAFDERMPMALAAETGRVIGFVSERSYPGRSVAAMNYAQMVAVGGKRTVLVDLDWSQAYLTGRVAPQASLGVPDLMGKGEPVAPERLFWLDERSGLFFLPNRALASEAGLDPAVFDTAALGAMLRRLSKSFDQVVVDFSALGETVDAAALGETVQGYVVCADWGSTPVARLQRLMRSAGVPRAKLLGAVMTGVGEDTLARYEFSA